MNGKSLTPEQEKIAALKKILPEAFTESKIDWEKLKATLGEEINFSNERYVLNWAGKSDAFRVLQEPTTQTLIPAKKESVDFDNTGNIFIEGENLEALKVLQKSYFGKIKMIYIDPPYNTGNDSFIYPDKFSETKADYEKRVGDKDEEGYLTKDGIFRKNSKENGQYHSNWLNMMMPRLYLAKNLLRQDGVMFVSIDDNEVYNLRLLMNEIFGEENFIGNIIWKKKTNGNNMGLIPPVHDFIIVFSKRIEAISEQDFGYPLTEAFIRKTYSNPDDDPKGPWTTMDLSANHKGPYFPIVNPQNGEKYYPTKGRYWVFNEKEVLRRINNGRIIFGKSGNSKPVQKVYLIERNKKRNKSESWWDKHGLNADGTKELTNLFNSPKIFSHSKPSQTIKHLINIATNKKNDDIILDFFAGSGTTAHAVMELNKEDGGKRKCISIQLPELTDEKSTAYKAGYKTIAEIAKERIRRAGKKIAEELETGEMKKEGKFDSERKKKKKKYKETEPILFEVNENQENQYNHKNHSTDLGFKVFKLSDSNFKQWRQAEGKDNAALSDQIKMFVDPVAEGSTTENMVYELLLKSGKDLNAVLRQIPERSRRKDGGYYTVNDNEMVLLLEKVSQEIVRDVIALKPEKVIALDRLFKDNDPLKTNTVLQMKDAGIAFKTV